MNNNMSQETPALRTSSFNIDEFQRELDVTASYLRADTVESQSVLRKSLNQTLRSSQEPLFHPTTEPASQVIDKAVELGKEAFREYEDVLNHSAKTRSIPAAAPRVTFTNESSAAPPRGVAERIESPSPAGKYSEKKERELLVQRLLTDYNNRKDKKSSSPSAVASSTLSDTARSTPQVTFEEPVETISFSGGQSRGPVDNQFLPPLSPHPSAAMYSPSPYSATVNSAQPTPTAYTPSTASSSTRSTPQSEDSTDSRRGDRDTLFFASDLYTADLSAGNKDDGQLYEDSLFERLQASHNPQNSETIRFSSSRNRYSQPEVATSLDANLPVLHEDDDSHQLSEKLSLVSSVSSLPQSISHTENNRHSLAQTVQWTREPQPWERAMPDYDFAVTRLSEEKPFRDLSRPSASPTAVSTAHGMGMSSLRDEPIDDYSPPTMTTDENQPQNWFTLDPNQDRHFPSASAFDFSTQFKPTKTKTNDSTKHTRFSERHSRRRSHSPHARETSRSSSQSRHTAKGSSASPVRSLSATHARKTQPSPSRGEFLKNKSVLQAEAEMEFRRNHPFSPQLATQPSSSTRPRTSAGEERGKDKETTRIHSREVSRRIHEMQEKHMRKLEERERMRYELEQMELLQCTFTPQMNPQSQRIALGKEMRQKGQQHNKNSTEKPSISRSVSPTPRLSPGVSATATAAAAAHRPSHSEAVVTADAAQRGEEASRRLHIDASQRAHYQHWLSSEMEKIQLSSCTFTPRINSNPIRGTTSKTRDERPLCERVHDVQREQRHALQRLREHVEQESHADWTFRPQLDPHSKELADKRWQPPDQERHTTTTNTQSDVSESAWAALRELASRDESADVTLRLFSEGKRIAQRKQLLIQEREQQLAEQLEQPLLCSGSRKIVSTSEFAGVDFATRQRLHAQRVNQRSDARRRDVDEKTSNWFSPTVSANTIAILSSRRPELLEENVDSRVDRLTYVDKEQSAAVRRALERDLYASVTFTPKIDPISQLFGRKSSLQELHENARGKQKMNRVRQRVEQSLEAECTFQPHINAKSRQLAEPDEYEKLYADYQREFAAQGFAERDAVASPVTVKRGMGRINRHDPESMLEEIKLQTMQKEETRRQMLMCKEIQELQECTFHPNVHAYPAVCEPHGPIVVKGLARHLQNCERSQRLRDEAKQREFEAFHVVKVDKFRRAEDGLTQVQPFVFNESHRRQPQ